MKNHLVESHGFKFVTEIVHHKSLVEFEVWKENIINEHQCNFIQLKGQSKLANGDAVQYLRCNRSGFYQRKEKEKKNRKQLHCIIKGQS